MSDAPRSRRLARILLVLSLALNFILLGLIGGTVWRVAGHDRPPRAYDVAVGPLGRALSPEDRRAIGETMRARDDLPRGRRGGGDIEAITAALRADPFDRGALQEALLLPSRRQAEVRDAALQILADRIGETTPEERAALAERLEAESAERRR